MSMITEVLNFILPENDFIQIFFLVVIFGCASLTIFTVRKYASPTYWENKWNGGTVDDTSDDLDAEHGSVNDISHAVATAPEKIAEIMPGILLILGLLGTFLGLGIALNKASTILLEANSGAGMDGAMANLMGMMQGLGTKFKTSTWGIMAFLSLRVWISWNGFEEKRLRWCVLKMKSEFDKTRTEKELKKQKAGEALIQAINQMGTNLCASLQEEMSSNRTVLSQNKALLEQKIQLSNQSHERIDSLKYLLEAQNTALIQSINVMDSNFSASLQKEMSHNREELEKHTALLEEKTNISNQIKGRIDSANNLLESQLQHSEATRESIESFVNANSENISSLQKSATQMSEAASRMGISAGELNGAINVFRDNVSDVLDTLKEDLGDTISNMSSEFGKNLTEISANLGEATAGIGRAVDKLSTNVGDTMRSVEQSIGKSVEIQNKAHNEFIVTSDTLNVQVQSMTGLVNVLRGDIVSGLKAVSENGQRVASLTKHYETITENSAKTECAIRDLIEQVKTTTTEGTKENKEMVESIVSNSKKTESAIVSLAEEIKKFSSKIARSASHSSGDVSREG